MSAIDAKLVRDTETRTVDTRLDRETGVCTTSIETLRTVRLALAGAPVMVTGLHGSYRYRPELLTLTLRDGKLWFFETWGYGIKKDGTKGRVTIEDSFTDSGECRHYAPQDAPAEIMDIVRRYAA